ncbi:nucleoprotein [Almpiwar virus]|uniref:Nucleoprotein n=1 Tax=Almpiwar virus TaxID=318843 RepID=A0A024A135_9RHAB|nr:nucleoprotein [Almpiwar virus]AHY85659.1 nucleoprotein [Almpiwar virus]
MAWYLKGSNEGFTPSDKRSLRTFDYPSESYITEHKPVVKIYDSDKNAQDLKALVLGGLKHNNLSINVFLTWLMKSNLAKTLTLTEKWKSFGRVIGEANSAISFKEILKIESAGQLDTGKLTEDSTNIDKASDLAVAMMGLAPFRAHSNKNASYATQIINNLNGYLKSMTVNHFTITGDCSMYSGWLNDQNFIRVVAALDMFYHRFSEDDNAMVRFCTLNARFKHCSAYLSIGYFCNATGMDEHQFPKWVWSRKVGEQIVRVFKDGQESEEEYSYFPYSFCFGLVRHNPYSAASNPELNAWIHIFGALTGKTRSIRANNVGDYDSNTILIQALQMAYAFSGSDTSEAVFSKTPNDKPAASSFDGMAGRDGKKVVSLEDVFPVGRDGEVWRKYFAAKGVNADVLKWYKNAVDKIEADRENTIGHYLKSANPRITKK